MTVRFISGSVEGGAKLATRDVVFDTKTEAIAAIRQQNYRPGPRILENGHRIRLAYGFKPAKA